MGTCQSNGVHVKWPITSENLCHTYQILFVVKSEKSDRKSLRTVMIKVSLFHYVRNSKSLMKKSLSLLQSKVSNLTKCKVQKASFENL